MNVLICNVGSTSLKYRLLNMEDGELELAYGRFERVGSQAGFAVWQDHTGQKGERQLPLPSHREAIECMLENLVGGVVASLEEIACVGFKVVIANGVTGVQFLDEAVLQAMADFNTIAPAHNPPYIAAIRQFREVAPTLPLIGSFETGFHATMKPEAYLYSLPAELAAQGIRRYGVHGASHEYMSQWVAARENRTDLKLVTCHLGGSGSLCAVLNGQSVDTTVGLSLQSGIMHNNRIGDIDPYITFYLQDVKGMSREEIQTLYSEQSGFYGMSGGLSNDCRDIEAAAANGNVLAQQTLASYCYQIRKQIGAYAAAMGGLDVIAFAGGIGENSPLIREQALKDLEFLGVRLDRNVNRCSPVNTRISVYGFPVHVYIVATNEEIIVARKAVALLQS